VDAGDSLAIGLDRQHELGCLSRRAELGSDIVKEKRRSFKLETARSLELDEALSQAATHWLSIASEGTR
jgi:hypothetical protein